MWRRGKLESMQTQDGSSGTRQRLQKVAIDKGKAVRDAGV